MRLRLRRPPFDTHLSLWLDTAIVNVECATQPWERRFWHRVKKFIERRIGL